MAPYLRRLTVLAMAATLGGACRDAGTLPPPPAVSASSAGTELAYHEVGHWSGRGDRQTDSFDVTTGALWLHWKARETTPGAGRLRVTLHSAISGRALQTVLDVRGSGEESVYFTDEPRVSYLVIESDGVEWQLELSQAGRLEIPGRTK